MLMGQLVEAIEQGQLTPPQPLLAGGSRRRS